MEAMRELPLSHVAEYPSAGPALMGGMALQLFSIATQLDGPDSFVRRADHALQPCERAERVPGGIELSDVLFEQLGYSPSHAKQCGNPCWSAIWCTQIMGL